MHSSLLKSVLKHNSLALDGSNLRASEINTASTPSPASPAKKMKQEKPTVLPKPAKSLKSPKSPKSPKSATSSATPRAVCLCAPTNHPGSFRCRFHRARSTPSQKAASSECKTSGIPRAPRPSRLSAASVQVS